MLNKIKEQYKRPFRWWVWDKVILLHKCISSSFYSNYSYKINITTQTFMENLTKCYTCRLCVFTIYSWLNDIAHIAFSATKVSFRVIQWVYQSSNYDELFSFNTIRVVPSAVAYKKHFFIEIWFWPTGKSKIFSEGHPTN